MRFSRVAIGVAAAFLAVCLAQSALAQASYTITDLGAPAGCQSQGNSVNASGPNCALAAPNASDVCRG